METKTRIQYKRLVFKPYISWGEPPVVGQPLCRITKSEQGDNLYYMLLEIEGPYLYGNGERYYVLKAVPLPMEEYKQGIKTQKYELSTYLIFHRELEDGGLIDYQDVPKRVKSRMELLMEQVS